MSFFNDDSISVNCEPNANIHMPDSTERWYENDWQWNDEEAGQNNYQENIHTANIKWIEYANSGLTPVSCVVLIS